MLSRPEFVSKARASRSAVARRSSCSGNVGTYVHLRSCLTLPFLDMRFRSGVDKEPDSLSLFLSLSFSLCLTHSRTHSCEALVGGMRRAQIPPVNEGLRAHDPGA